ncbi:CPBP family intramembrane glutamic endopeptidase [Ectobacillus ponti]|uniref:CPBP family intramembrane metalloprotease n=1 Tax=Ectobacillus ponti TaxID=2961894 RepID=A0AA41X8V2_9BACI|nr:CPBP family intramembrane glutamic endopeptidase [Ectobacillus ponti]MCP8968438.1 CPBP family intramembrane metalloprotease [Ectobacillus ponti]
MELQTQRVSYVRAIDKGESLWKMLLYLAIVYTIFSIGDILNQSTYMYPSVWKMKSGVVILLYSFVYRPARRMYVHAFNVSVMKKWSTYGWMLGVYVTFFALNHVFFKYDIFMNDWTVKNYNLGIRSMYITPQVFGLYAFTSVLLFPVWEELIMRVYTTVFLSRWLPLWTAAILQAVIFGSLHQDSPVLDGLFALLAFFLWYRTKSILPAIIVHMLFNLHSGLLMFYNLDFVPRW